jgi:hypothetical protein
MNARPIPITSSPERLDWLLSEVDEKCALNDVLPDAISFEVDCLMLLANRIPGKLQKEAQVLFDHRKDRPPRDVVEAASVKCWQFLKEDYPDIDVDDPAVAIVRAMICTLHLMKGDGLEDFVDEVGFFLEMVHHVATNCEVEESLIRCYFGVYLDS